MFVIVKIRQKLREFTKNGLKGYTFFVDPESIQKLLIKMYKAFHNMQGCTFGDFFIQVETVLSLGPQLHLSIPSVSTVRNGQNS